MSKINLSGRSPRLILGGVIVIAILAISLVIGSPGFSHSANADITPSPQAGLGLDLPSFSSDPSITGVVRLANIHTNQSTHPRETVEDYTISSGDSIFGIAKYFNLHPETVLWANYSLLKDNPESISPGDVLKIPPVDGILYQWKNGDTVDSVAAAYNANPYDILAWPGNHLDMGNPVVTPGTYIMIPGGSRALVQWVVPIIASGKAGVITNILGPGGCQVSSVGYGTGTFIWPTPQHVLSGNDFWSGHLGIDIAAGLGDHVSAADSGVVIYAGAISGGYGNMVMIDHGNGYQTLYAHLSQVIARCGQSVTQGQLIGLAGSTGNSTGPHLHFEVRFMGGFINPWTVLP